MFNDVHELFLSMINGHPSILPQQSFKISLPFPELWCPNHSTGSRSKSSGALPLGSWWLPEVYFPKAIQKKVELHHVQPQHGVYYFNKPEVVHFCRIALSLWGSSRFRSLTQYQWRTIYCKIWITSSFHRRWFDLYGHTYQHPLIINKADSECPSQYQSPPGFSRLLYK